MKQKTYALSEDERRAATRAALAGLESGELNEPPERKRAIYGIFEARDARFDGRVYVGVSSTGVYCRPVCPYHAKLENVTFYASAATAEAAGYRPCLVCRPETAPGTSLADSRGSLARRAACTIARECTVGVDIESLSARLGYTSRHVRRVFLGEYGVTPVAFLRTCRCSLAKSLLADTDLPISQVAFASGFKSVRRFNDVFKSRYGLVPSEQRRLARACCGRAAERRDAIRLRLGYRPPLRFEELLAFYRRRAIAGVEAVDGRAYARTVRVVLPGGAEATGWVRVEDDSAHNCLLLSMSDSLLPATSIVVARVRRMFDLDCDTEVVGDALAPMEGIVCGAHVRGTRLPGCFDGFEACCRAVLERWGDAEAAGAALARIARAAGNRADADITGLEFVWPTPAQLIATMESAASALAELGVPQSCAQTIEHVARLAESGELGFEMPINMPALAKALLPVEGVDAWVVGYVALRAFSYPDAFLLGDAGEVARLPDDASMTAALPDEVALPVPLAGGAGTLAWLPDDASAAAALSGDADALAPWPADAPAPAPLQADASAAEVSAGGQAGERAAAIEACRPWRSYATVALLNALEALGAHGDMHE